MKKYQEQLKKLRTMYSMMELSEKFNTSTSHLYNLINEKKQAGFELKGKINRLYTLTFAPEQKPKYKNKLHNKINVIINISLPILIMIGTIGLSLYLIINLI